MYRHTAVLLSFILVNGPGCTVPKIDKKEYATKWMSFTAFKYADNNEILAFRKIERLQNKIIKLKCHLQFNETCIINKMLPTYTNVNLHDDAARKNLYWNFG